MTAPELSDATYDEIAAVLLEEAAKASA